MSLNIHDPDILCELSVITCAPRLKRDPPEMTRGHTKMKKLLIAALAASFVSPVFAESRPEPFAGDVVNRSPYRVLVWGDNVRGANTGVGYACVQANSSTHGWGWANDVDFAYSASRRQWCKIGIWQAEINANATWHCPEGWSAPNYLRYDLGC
jgi:hypothetical protein